MRVGITTLATVTRDGAEWAVRRYDVRSARVLSDDVGAAVAALARSADGLCDLDVSNDPALGLHPAHPLDSRGHATAGSIRPFEGFAVSVDT